LIGGRFSRQRRPEVFAMRVLMRASIILRNSLSEERSIAGSARQ
jgi:hypothetical protein